MPVYNPQSLSKGEAIAQFHAREGVYHRLLELLREERPSHVLIIGTRGMGKTTLLQRVRYGVEEDAALNGRYLPLVFPEEQYNVNRLDRFYLNTVDALADTQERLGNEKILARVESFAQEISKRDREEIEQRVPQFLAEMTQLTGRSLLFLVDNAERLFETIADKEQWRLRELLAARPDLTFFGASTQASDGIYGPDRAFFEFFQIFKLTPLTLEEVRNLMLRLSESVEEPEGQKGVVKRRIEDWLAADPGRLRTLVHLTGGNPRTTVLLFHLVLDGLTGGAREYLEQLLDQCTPNYKGRVDELPAQAQQVLDAVALHWDPVTASEVAEDTNLETSAVSTQLTRLVRQGILEKADSGDSKKALYQVAERFFNIWYLMRASRRVRARLRWFVEFLRVFFEPGELEAMAWKELYRVRDGGPECQLDNAMAYAAASGRSRHRFEGYLRENFGRSESEWRPLLELMPGEPSLDQLSSESEANGELSRGGAIETEAELRSSLEIDPTDSVRWGELANQLAEIPERGAEAEAAYRKAIQVNPKSALAWYNLGVHLAKLPERSAEAETAYQKSIELNPKFASSWHNLGALLMKSPERSAEAERAYRKASELDPNLALPWDGLGNLLSKSLDRSAEAEEAYRRAIVLNPEPARSWHNLAALVMKFPDRSGEAERAYRKAIELDPKLALSWNGLGNLLSKSPDRSAEAEAAYRKAIELEPKLAVPWNGLGNLLSKSLERSAEAETAYRKAIELEPKLAVPWYGLGSLLSKSPDRSAEAETAYRKAIELDPKLALSWNGLGNLLSKSPDRSAEAETAYRTSIELDANSPWPWQGLGYLLTRIRRSGEAEDAYRKALEADPTSSSSWNTLGIFLASQAGKPEDAAQAFRQVVQLEPNNEGARQCLAVLLFCELGRPEEAEALLQRTVQLDLENPVLAAIFTAVRRAPESDVGALTFLDAAAKSEFWSELLVLNQNYAPFGKILLKICDLVEQHDHSNPFTRLYRMVALARLGDFPRASVAFEDALLGDPIELLGKGRAALEAFFTAAVKAGRVRECLDVLVKKEWIDAWRPIYEALKAVEAGSRVYLKRVAVEIREPALSILGKIAPDLPD
ncbi:MAG: tetratricopeptide repeat protein [Bryobacteraceae bacterium]|nr:tetratricopeptide repeat protein [Bryobacteraceae bacterium]